MTEVSPDFSSKRKFSVPFPQLIIYSHAPLWCYIISLHLKTYLNELKVGEPFNALWYPLPLFTEAVQSRAWVWLLQYWDPGFESRSRYGCLFASVCVVLTNGLPNIQGILPGVEEQTSETSFSMSGLRVNSSKLFNCYWIDLVLRAYTKICSANTFSFIGQSVLNSRVFKLHEV
jgi:hypothetical protein